MSRISAALVTVAMSLTAGVAANAAPVSDDPEPDGSSSDSVVVIQTGVPDYFCDEGTGQHVILNPKGCYGTLHTYMDGRYQGSINLASFRASQGPSAWDSFTRLDNAMESFCSTHPVACTITIGTIQAICRKVFNLKAAVVESLPTPEERYRADVA
jgi:hypothetical protein